MNVHFRLTRTLLNELHADLSRPHPFAFERVAFVSCTLAEQDVGGLLVLASRVHPVADHDYEQDHTVGAMLGPGAFRQALQFAYSNSVAMFHVHRHEHHGQPAFSAVDQKESARFVPDFWKVQPRFPHGTIVLSHDSFAGLAWLPQTKQPVSISRFSVIGNLLQDVEHGTY